MTQAVLTVAGLGIVCLVLVDVFYTVLFPASGHGPLRDPLAGALRALFEVSRWIRSDQLRRRVLSYAGPVQVSVTLIVWFSLLLLGWAVLYRPALGHGITAAKGATHVSWVTATYLSGYVLTTLGQGDVVATTPSYRLAMVAEAATGFATITLVIAYFNSVYTTLTNRNTFALALHHRSAGTDQGHHVVSRLWREGDVAAAVHLAEMSADLRALTQTHRAYPVLRSFHSRQDYDAVPLILLTCLETSALLRTTVAPDPSATDGRSALHGSGAEELRQAALTMCEEVLVSRVPDGAAHEPAWRRHHHRVVAELVAAGVPVRPCADAVTAYVADRATWDASLAATARALAYEWPQRVAAQEGAVPQLGR